MSQFAMYILFHLLFFFKQKTAYEMRISDWSSDVCSSDLRFDRPDVEYQQALYTAVNRALERRPQAVFDLVAVAPSRGSAAQAAANTTTARRNADRKSVV